MTAPLTLRDVHSGMTPSWWPPAPGWWMLAVLLLSVTAVFAVWRLHKRRRKVAVMRLFDVAVDRAQTQPLKIAAMSELLRRAARSSDPAAGTLEGQAWLDFLDDGMQGQPFSTGPGAVLRDGGFRVDVATEDVAALRMIARQRYLMWMQRP